MTDQGETRLSKAELRERYEADVRQRMANAGMGGTPHHKRDAQGRYERHDIEAEFSGWRLGYLAQARLAVQAEPDAAGLVAKAEETKRIIRMVAQAHFRPRESFMEAFVNDLSSRLAAALSRPSAEKGEGLARDLDAIRLDGAYTLFDNDKRALKDAAALLRAAPPQPATGLERGDALHGYLGTVRENLRLIRFGLDGQSITEIGDQLAAVESNIDATLADQIIALATAPRASSAGGEGELRRVLGEVRDRFFPANQPERDRDIMWDDVNAALQASGAGEGAKT